jgi:hypothetical protein
MINGHKLYGNQAAEAAEEAARRAADPQALQVLLGDGWCLVTTSGNGVATFESMSCVMHKKRRAT